jgi:hypothetical protein
MATSHPIGVRAPWYARTATTAGRPVVLAVTLLMCAPGEYHLARLAGWNWQFAGGMPFAMSAYAGIAAVVASHRPKGSRARFSAIAGAVTAILLTLAAQVVSHLITTGHMAADQAWLVGVVSAVPPAVVGHLLHLAASPAIVAAPTGPGRPRVRRLAARRIRQTDAPSVPVTAPAIPPRPAQPPALPVTYTDPRCLAIRPLYNGGYRPGTQTMRAALTVAGHLGVGSRPLSGGTIRGAIRAEVERHEPHLAALPDEPTALRAAAP